MSKAERHQLLTEWSGRPSLYPRSASLQELFEQQVQIASDAVALGFEGEQLSYDKLNRRANQLAHQLRKRGVGPEGGVGIAMGRSVEMSVVRLVKHTNYASLDCHQVFLQFAPLLFDASTFEIWGSLLNGARLIVMPPGLPSLRDLGEMIASHGVTKLWLTAGLFHQMVDSQLEPLGGVRQLLAGGDER